MSERIGFQPELSQEEVQTRLAPFCEEDNEGRIYFKDPVTNQRIVPGEPLVCIEEQDPMCAQGLATLRRLGQEGRLSITLLFGYIGTKLTSSVS